MMQEFVTEIYNLVDRAIGETHTALPGEITSFDVETGLASVQPRAKYRKPNGETLDYPIITGVPVMFPQSSGFTIAYPIRAGDGCLLIFSDEALDFWQYGKETGTRLKHDLTNAIAIPGLSAISNAAMRSACAEQAVIVSAGNTVLKVAESGISVQGSLTVSGDVIARGISLAKHTHGGDSGGTTTAPR